MLGLPKGKVFLIAWTAEWEKEFTSENKQIENELGELILAVHHIGSTAVKNLSAKPIIDIAIELKEFQLGNQCVHGLERLGYAYKGTNILPDRHYLSKGEPRTQQIHMYQTGSLYLEKQFAFRDYLLTNDAELKEYQELKVKLSQAYQTDKLLYADEKTELVNSILDSLGFAPTACKNN
ncbi:GrpB family protein [Bacillus sp. FJAT-28004]|uniref:GrpB family protein n=1 Tax=Bacillus sp. FJAT-28004 TaxID=1679165 RepID=UPI0006B575BF|nr:GrpB family protein [Bacillus sp. FJAT-28004]